MYLEHTQLSLAKSTYMNILFFTILRVLLCKVLNKQPEPYQALIP